MDDEQIVDLFWARSEQAIGETDKKYGKFCYGLAFRILDDRQDSEECVNDTYLKTWNAIPPGRPGSLIAFLGKIIRNLALNRREKNFAEKRGGGEVPAALDELAECIPDPNSLDRRMEQKALTESLNRFLGKLSGESRRIFLSRYWELCSVREVADIYGISESKVKVSLYRTRGKLKSFLEKEGIEL